MSFKNSVHPTGLLWRLSKLMYMKCLVQCLMYSKSSITVSWYHCYYYRCCHYDHLCLDYSELLEKDIYKNLEKAKFQGLITKISWQLSSVLALGRKCDYFWRRSFSRLTTVVNKRTSRFRFQSWLCHSLAVWPGINHFTLSSLRFLIGKIGKLKELSLDACVMPHVS